MRRFLVIVLIFLTSTTQADQLADCNKVLSLCEATVNTQQVVIEAKDNTIRALIADRERALRDLEEERKKTSPWIYGLVGVAVGVTAGFLLGGRR